MDTKEKRSGQRQRRPEQENRKKTDSRKRGSQTAEAASPRRASGETAVKRKTKTQRQTMTRGERAAEKAHRRKNTAVFRSAPESTRRNTGGTSNPNRTRKVRPPRKDLPEVVYTMPKPFRKGKFLLKLCSVLAVVLACMMAVSIFFRVDTIQVSGTEKYTPMMVREASGIEEGDALLGVSKPKISGKIIKKLPYVDRVKISRHLPGTVDIEIWELKVTYAIQAIDASWWLITSDGRIVDQIDESSASGFTRITGVQIDAPRKDQYAQAVMTPTVPENVENIPVETNELVIPTEPQMDQAGKLSVALELISALENNEIIGQIASVNITDAKNITMEFGQRFHVLLGNHEKLAYKISYMAQTVKQVPDDMTGVLDVSFEFSDEALLTPEG